MQKLSNLLSRRRATYSVLIGIILLTLPCYIIGFVALGIAPRDRSTPTPSQMTPTFFVLATLTNTGATPTLGDLPTQFVPPTRTPRSDVSATPTLIISATPLPTPTETATLTPSPTATITPTPSPTVTPPTPPTATPTETATPEPPTETPTLEPTATGETPPVFSTPTSAP